MGASPQDPERFRREEMPHLVQVTKPFLLGETEVTQGHWKAVMGTSPWSGQHLAPKGDDYPATWISWDDAVAFCGELQRREKRAYRLPTEAEWEYACRAGSTTEFSFGNDVERLGDYAWVRANTYDLPGLVARKLPNKWGLFDLHGGVWEWCSDWYSELSADPATDPQGPERGIKKVIRGGGFWSLDQSDYRSATRRSGSPRGLHPEFGMRVVLEFEE